MVGLVYVNYVQVGRLYFYLPWEMNQMPMKAASPGVIDFHRNWLQCSIQQKITANARLEINTITARASRVLSRSIYENHDKKLLKTTSYEKLFAVLLCQKIK